MNPPATARDLGTYRNVGRVLTDRGTEELAGGGAVGVRDQLEIVLSLSTYAGGVPGQGSAVMDRIRDLLVGFQKFYPHDQTLTRRDGANQFLGERLPSGHLQAWEAHRWKAVGGLPDITASGSYETRRVN